MSRRVIVSRLTSIRIACDRWVDHLILQADRRTVRRRIAKATHRVWPAQVHCLSTFVRPGGKARWRYRRNQSNEAPRLAIATVCLVGHPRGQAGRRGGGALPRHRDLRARPRRVAVVAAPGRGRSAPAAACRSTSTSRSATSRRSRPTCFAANLRRAERKFDVLEQLGARPMLVCSSVSPTPWTTTTSPPSSCTRWPTGPQRRGMRIAYEALAWGRFVNTYAHAWRIVRRADHPALGLCLDSFHVLSRGDDAGRHPGHPGREGVPPAAGRRAAAEHGRGRVEPAPPAVPRPGLVRPGRLRRPRARHRVRRPAVARGVQRRLPAGRSPARRHRRHALAARPAGGGRHARPGGGPRAAADLAACRRRRGWAGTCSPSSPSTTSPARSWRAP